MKIRHGWIYREPAVAATPARLRVKLTYGQKLEKTFDDNNNGAAEAAEWISSVVGETWKLEDLAFLGYRIFTESN